MTAKKQGKSFWLMKSEPDVFSFDDLLKAPKRTTFWHGVRNYQARNFMRDLFRLGDGVLFYHSNTDEPGIVGVAEVVREGYPDPTALDPKSEYYDAAAKKRGDNPWVMVDVKAVMSLKRTVTRDLLMENARTKGMLVLKRGQRLSVQPVTKEEFEEVLALGCAKPL